MPESKYIYNPATLRYERSRISIGSVLLTTFGLLSFGMMFFAGLVYLQNYFIETPAEKALRTENAALKAYKVDLNLLFVSAETRLADLEQKDKALYEKIFETPRIDVVSDDAADRAMLLADASTFRDDASLVQSKSDALFNKAITHNNNFSETASSYKKDEAMMASVPTFPPLANFGPSRVVSGFGVRINPFHKGKYHHDGIDLAAPRGSEVLAAAPGTVIGVAYSDLQAGFGHYVMIDHGHGYVTRYANLGETTVYQGQRVTKGMVIGRIGISGGSVAPHVHYEVIRDSKNLDPVRFLMHGLTAVDYDATVQAAAKQNQSLD